MKPDRESDVANPKCRHWRPDAIRVRKLADYRLYGLDGVNKVASAEWIEADADETAIEVATEKFDGSICEVWQGPRLVARLDLRGQR